MTNAGMLAAERAGMGVPAPVPAPVGGWNTRDPRSGMKPYDAVTLDNLFPGTSSVKSRNGASAYATGFASAVETLMEFLSEGTREFFAASGTAIYDISTSGAISAAVVSGLTSARWQHVMFAQQLHLANGVDAPRAYDGSSWSSPSWSGSGLTVTDLLGVHAHGNRLYFWENAAPWFWYAGNGAVSGTLTKFDLSRIATRGGNVVLIKSISRDSGAGADDYLAIFMGNGEVLVYSGTDPGDASFAIVGRYQIGEPLSIRSAVDYKGDVLVITKSDYSSLSDMMRESGFNGKPSKLVGAIRDAAVAYGANYGWQAILYPKGNMILFNVPVAENSAYHQYVVNSITGAPCRFTGWNARCFGVYNNRLYYGGATKVYLADDGQSDDGANIVINAQQAYSSLGSRTKKRVTQARILTSSTGVVSFNIGAAYDYGDTALSQEVSSDPGGLEWDEFYWDEEYWTPENVVRGDRFSVSGSGTNVGLRLRASIKNQTVEWFETQYFYKRLSGF